MQTLVEKHTAILRELTQLKSCPLNADELKSTLDRIQNVVDALNLENYSNLDSWVRELDGEVENILLGRRT